jgi:hypothetical protein
VLTQACSFDRSALTVIRYFTAPCVLIQACSFDRSALTVIRYFTAPCVLIWSLFRPGPARGA